MIEFPFVFFLILLFFLHIRNKEITIGFFLVSIYAFSALMGIFLYNVDILSYNQIEISLNSIFYYCGFLTLFFLPFLSYRHFDINLIRKPNILYFRKISWFFILTNVSGILLILKYILFVLSNNPGSFKNDAESLLLSLGYNLNFLEMIGQFLLSYFSDFYVIIIVFFFYSITFLENTKKFNILLFVSSLGTVFNGLQVGGRTQIIYWLLIFTSCFLFFKKHMNAPVLKFSKQISLGVLFALVSYFAVVTIDRFGNEAPTLSDYNEAISLLDYSGQSFINFNYFLQNFDDKNFTLSRIFPITSDFFNVLINKPKFDLWDYRDGLSLNIGIFYTFLGDLYVDIGVLGTIIYLIFYLFVFYFSQRFDNQKREKDFHQLILYFALLQLPLNGLFYYSLWNKTATFSIVGTIIIYFILKKTRINSDE